MRRVPQADPLPRRSTDRLAEAATWLLVAAALLTVVLAVAVGVGVHSGVLEKASQETAERTSVQATALRDAPYHAVPGPVVVLTYGEVSWTTPDGRTRTGTVIVPPLTKAGQQVPIWLDAAGDPLDWPADGCTALIVGLTSAFVVALVGGSVLSTAWAGVRHGIGVLNDRQWEREWSRVGPEWTGPGGDRHDVGDRPPE